MIDMNMTICGIPASVRILADGDYEICDQRGRPAAWLERKMTGADHARVERAIGDHLGAMAEACWANEVDWRIKAGKEGRYE